MTRYQIAYWLTFPHAVLWRLRFALRMLRTGFDKTRFSLLVLGAGIGGDWPDYGRRRRQRRHASERGVDPVSDDDDAVCRRDARDHRWHAQHGRNPAGVRRAHAAAVTALLAGGLAGFGPRSRP